MNYRQGLSLIELLIGIAVGMLILMATLSIVTNLLQRRTISQNLGQIERTSETIFNDLTTEIHNAANAEINFQSLTIIPPANDQGLINVEFKVPTDGEHKQRMVKIYRYENGEERTTVLSPDSITIEEFFVADKSGIDQLLAQPEDLPPLIGTSITLTHRSFRSVALQRSKKTTISGRYNRSADSIIRPDATPEPTPLPTITCENVDNYCTEEKCICAANCAYAGQEVITGESCGSPATIMASCHEACTGDRCLCPENCENEDTSQGNTCGATYLDSCSEICNDPVNGCACPNLSCQNLTAVYGQSCGVAPNLVVISTCTAQCTAPQGCTCQTSNCTNDGESIDQGEYCGPTELNNCNSTCNDNSQGCLCTNSNCVNHTDVIGQGETCGGEIEIIDLVDCYQTCSATDGKCECVNASCNKYGSIINNDQTCGGSPTVLNQNQACHVDCTNAAGYICTNNNCSKDNSVIKKNQDCGKYILKTRTAVCNPQEYNGCTCPGYCDRDNTPRGGTCDYLINE